MAAARSSRDPRDRLTVELLARTGMTCPGPLPSSMLLGVPLEHEAHDDGRCTGQRSLRRLSSRERSGHSCREVQVGSHDLSGPIRRFARRSG